MLKISVLNWEGEKVSETELREDIFSLPLDKSLLHREVCRYRNAKRRGTHKTKTRGAVRGGGKKPFRQKGTGRARQGSIRSPLLKGGGVIHGPLPRSYEQSLPRKIRQKAFGTALSYLFAENRLFFVESMSSKEGKTKELSSRLKKFFVKKIGPEKPGQAKALLADGAREEKFARASGNLKNFKFTSAQGVNVYDMLKFDCAIWTPAVLPEIYKKCGIPEEGAPSSAKEEKSFAGSCKKPSEQEARESLGKKTRESALEV